MRSHERSTLCRTTGSIEASALDDAVEICCALDAASSAHLAAVRALRGAPRRDSSASLDELDERRDDEADAAFPPERLARQHARILQRVEHDGRPGAPDRLPGRSTSSAAVLTRSRPRSAGRPPSPPRRSSSACSTGQLDAQLRRSARIDAARRRISSRTKPTSRRCAPCRRRSRTTSSSARSRVAVAQIGPAALRPLDAMTPAAARTHLDANCAWMTVRWTQPLPPLIFRKGLDLKHEVAHVLAGATTASSSPRSRNPSYQLRRRAG